MTTETDIALLKREVKDLTDQNKRHREEINELKRLDNQRVRAGLVVMGGAVISLVLYIYNAGLGK